MFIFVCYSMKLPTIEIYRRKNDSSIILNLIALRALIKVDIFLSEISNKNQDPMFLKFKQSLPSDT